MTEAVLKMDGAMPVPRDKLIIKINNNKMLFIQEHSRH